MKTTIFAIVLAAAAGSVQASWNCILPKSYGGTAVNQFGDCVQNGNLNDIYPCRHQASTDIGRCKKQGNGCTPYKTGSEELGNVVKYADCSA